MKKPGTIVVDDLENPEEGANWRPMPRSFSTRRRLKISVEEYSARYRIPVDQLRAWEAGTATPDEVAEIYMLAIARDPEGMAKLVEARPPRRAVAKPVAAE